ncbi:MAG: cysteine hydrolase [Thermoproteota archaeon]|nr:cysteine hydrolase [Thermoproteota archaeon]
MGCRIIDEIKPNENDHIIIKRRDSAFQDTELRVWLQSVGINTLIFCGVDTSICVETSLRDGFNLGYDVILIADATASGTKKHYETTLERVHDYYGLVMDLDSLKKMLNVFESVSKGEMKIPHERMSAFLEKHNLLDLRTMEKVKI